MQDAKCKMRSVRERLLLLRNRPCSRQIDYWLPNLGPFGLRPSLRRRGDAAGCAVTIRGGAGFLDTCDCRLVPPLGDTESPECEVVIRHLYARGGRGPAEKESLKAMSNSKTRSRNKQRWAIRPWWYLEALNFRPFSLSVFFPVTSHSHLPVRRARRGTRVPAMSSPTDRPLPHPNFVHF